MAHSGIYGVASVCAVTQYLSCWKGFKAEHDMTGVQMAAEMVRYNA